VFAVAALNKEPKANKGTIFQRLRGYPPGNGKWEKIAKKLLPMSYENNIIIVLSVKNITDEIYTKEELAEATDFVPGFSLYYVEVFRSILNGKKGSQQMVWSSVSIRRIHRTGELETTIYNPNEAHRQDPRLRGSRLYSI
jgi:hypothetical protein